jgi:hypothetical protein
MIFTATAVVAPLPPLAPSVLPVLRFESIDALVERIKAGEQIYVKAPQKGMIYSLKADRCPEVAVVAHGLSLSGLGRQICITCAGLPCPAGCYNPENRREWPMARAVLTAIFCDRNINGLLTGRVCSSLVDRDSYREV